MKFTILGSSGFIGNIKKHLEEESIEYFLPDRDYTFSKHENLGHIIYCIGLTSDFRKKPLETVTAHVNGPIQVLENSTFESFIFIIYKSIQW